MILLNNFHGFILVYIAFWLPQNIFVNCIWILRKVLICLVCKLILCIFQFLEFIIVLKWIILVKYALWISGVEFRINNWCRIASKWAIHLSNISRYTLYIICSYSLTFLYIFNYGLAWSWIESIVWNSIQIHLSVVCITLKLTLRYLSFIIHCLIHIIVCIDFWKLESILSCFLI